MEAFFLFCIVLILLFLLAPRLLKGREMVRHAAPMRHVVPEDQMRLAPQPVAKAGAGKWVVVAACIFYLVMPLDLVPDVIPLVGWSDDLVAAIIGLRALIR